jgi:hypothetical protein
MRRFSILPPIHRRVECSWRDGQEARLKMRGASGKSSTLFAEWAHAMNHFTGTHESYHVWSYNKPRIAKGVDEAQKI